MRPTTTHPAPVLGSDRTQERADAARHTAHYHRRGLVARLRHRRQRRGTDAPVVITPTSPTSDEQFARSALGPVTRRRPPKRRKMLDRWGWYELRMEGAWSSTRQSEALNLATMRRSVRHEGAMTGRNKIAQSIVIVDPFELYGVEIDNINVAVVGDIGKAKSSLIKTAFVYRQLALGRQVVVIDKKLQAGRGEYSAIADELGITPIKFRAGGGGARLNLLDPQISQSSDAGDGGAVPAGQETVVAAAIEDMIGRALAETEHAAIGLSLTAVNTRARAQGREPELAELARELLDPTYDGAEHFGSVWGPEAARWGLHPGLALKRLCEGDLKGLVDGATSDDVHEALAHPFVLFDVSALPNKGPALRVIMTLVNTWLANRLVDRSLAQQQTILVIEEGWHIAEGSIGRVFRDNMKLSRGLGLCTVSAFHHLSDLPADSPARALMREAGIVFLYGQDRVEDAEDTVKMYHLPPGSVDIIMSLPKGHCLVIYGKSDPILMEHVRSSTEVRLTNTDEAIKGKRAA